MASSLLARKAAGQFAAFDRDGNGYIERSDYTAIADALLAEFGVKAASAGGRQLHAAYGDLFDRLRARMDTDGDGRVSEAEFVAAIELSVAKTGSGGVRPLAEAIFAVCDTDNDCVIGPEEFRRFMRVIGAAPGAAERISRERGGSFDRIGFVGLLEEFFTTTDEQAPVASVFGLPPTAG